MTILVESMIPYTRGILRDYGLTSLVTGIKALTMYETGGPEKVREPIKKKVIELAKELKAEGEFKDGVFRGAPPAASPFSATPLAHVRRAVREEGP